MTGHKSECAVSQPATGSYPVPSNEKERLDSLHDLKILDTPPDERFDRIVRLAAAHFQMPVCRVSFVDVDRNWFKASAGVKATQAPRSIAICSHAIMQDEALVVRELLDDERFCNSPQVVGGPKFRFYAGAPIILKNGMRVGSLCILDLEPHPEFSKNDADYLVDLAEIVAHELELHRRSEEQLQRLLDYDTLTELPNRAHVQSMLQTAIYQAVENRSKLALFYIDLDGFKEVNDTRGHLVGDQLLQEIGERLTTFRDENTIVGRLSGDEFVMIVTAYYDHNSLKRIGDQVCAALAEPVVLEQDVFSVSASIGISIGPPNDERQETLMQFSDLALYRAKADGGNCCRFFERKMYTDAKQRQRLAADLRHAIERDELRLHYQPQVSLKTGEIVGYEALLRWQHGEHGLIPPLQFIGLAEETGQICAIGEWVLKTACQNALLWPNCEKVSVNLSPVQFKHQNVTSVVKQVLASTGLPPDRLELEITENVLIQNEARVRTALRSLSAMGVSIALDDFGTGFSSLSYLTRYPFSKIKIDKAFIDDLGEKSDVSAIVAMIIQLGRALDTVITAEGIEEFDQHELLRLAGCDQGQGYFYGKPQAEIIDRNSKPDALTG